MGGIPTSLLLSSNKNRNGTLSRFPECWKWQFSTPCVRVARQIHLQHCQNKQCELELHTLVSSQQVSHRGIAPERTVALPNRCRNARGNPKAGPPSTPKIATKRCMKYMVCARVSATVCNNLKYGIDKTLNNLLRTSQAEPQPVHIVAGKGSGLKSGRPEKL